MGLFDSLVGIIRVELTSADVSISLRAINDMRIPINNLHPVNELTVRFDVSRNNLKRISSLICNKGDNIRILSRFGIFWWFWGLRQRPVLIGGTLLILLMSVILPGRVFFLEVEGNEQIPSGLILEAANSAGIGFGTSRRDIRSELMKNELLGALPQLQWAGINTYGCRAVISVKERTVESNLLENKVFSNMIASCDGIITSVTVTDGTANCSVGQAVQRGQLLISGYTDCGGVVTVSRAKGEIFAQTNHGITVVTPSENINRTYIKGSKRYFSLCIGKNRINFYKGSGISDGSCVKMVTQYYLTLPGGFKLPLSLIVEEKRQCQIRSNHIDHDESMEWLCAFARNLLRNQNVALEITDATEEVVEEDGLFILEAIYSCTEMISRERGEQIGDFYGKTD